MAANLRHGERFQWADFWPDFLASTFENWQSEFLQLVWQAVGLAAKLDRLLEERGIDPASIAAEVNTSL